MAGGPRVIGSGRRGGDIFHFCLSMVYEMRSLLTVCETYTRYLYFDTVRSDSGNHHFLEL